MILLKEGLIQILVYEKFEEYNGFKSLRRHLQILEDEWLSNEELSEEDPSLYPLSEIYHPVTNVKGEYIITVIRLFSDWENNRCLKQN